MTNFDDRLNLSWWVLRIGLGVGPIITGIDSYLVTIWLLGIAANLLTTGMFYDLAMRDVEIALGGFALSQITAVREGQVTLSEGAKATPNSRFAVTR